MNKQSLIKIFIINISILFVQSAVSQSNWMWSYPYPQGNDITSLFLKSGNVLTAYGECGTIISTSNFGANWTVTNKTCGISDNFASFYQLNTDVLFFGASSARIYKSTNGGANFNLYNTSTGGDVGVIQMLDLNTGYAYTQYELIKTTN